MFDQATLSDLIDYLLPNWLRVALINTQSPYSSGNGREILYEFYELLILFIEVLHGMLISEQLNNLLSTITDFFHQCPIDCIRRELADFLEAGIGHDGKAIFHPSQAHRLYLKNPAFRCL
ncbi:hypothetical protein [Niastella populi]|uniref:Uncharacterized protein n=1 Tax=Niastella populi TaxID=550983 RepID=A0A1V9F5A8_9BACT|nr:hypothetical protein [Niastella populi]OQP53573.1 hypothetical protein A4R26_06240 [Niastella populi]